MCFFTRCADGATSNGYPVLIAGAEGETLTAYRVRQEFSSCFKSRRGVEVGTDTITLFLLALLIRNRRKAGNGGGVYQPPCRPAYDDCRRVYRKFQAGC